MKKYYIGLIALGILVLILAGYVISLGIQSKEDKKTFKAVQEIANDLNSYVSKNQKIPESLNDAGINDVPSNVKYEKLGSTKYKFCATYKGDYGYGGSYYDITGSLSGSALQDAAEEDDYGYDREYFPSTLYVYGYKKGENCQTVEPILRTTNSNSSYCNTEALRQRYYYLCDTENDF